VQEKDLIKQLLKLNMVSASDYYLNKIQDDRKISLPRCLFNEISLKKFDNMIEKRESILLSNFYRDCIKNLNINELIKLNTKLKESRNVSNEDINLIKNLVLINNKDEGFFFDFSGNLIYISNLIEDIDKIKDNPLFSKSLMVSLCLYIYINMIELVVKHISELLKFKIINENLNKQYGFFLSKFKDNEHPEIGVMMRTLEELKFISKGNYKGIFNENRLLRNKITHANIFYDKDDNTIYLSSGKQYSLKEFQNDFSNFYDFLKEFVYQYNDSTSDLLKNINEKFKKLSKFFLKVSRSGVFKKHFSNIIFEWEK